MPPRTGNKPVVEITTSAPKKRGCANTKSAPPNLTDQTPGAGPSNQAVGADPTNETPADNRVVSRKKSRTSTWGQPPPLTQDAPDERTAQSDVDKTTRKPKRGQPDPPKLPANSTAPTKRFRPNPCASVTQTSVAEPGSSGAGPKPATNADNQDDDVVITGAEPGPDNEPMTAEV
ncbi:hypothetical protein FRC12_024389 [Ceratobasidium sp. 428]|nr:hypothetical protein FRC12_024389 [Ceratobasidium sp. 428]